MIQTTKERVDYMAEVHSTQMSTQTITQMATQNRLKEREELSSKEQINRVLARIEYMMEDLWEYTELDELGITQDVFVMFERLDHIQDVMGQESREVDINGR